MSYYSIINLLLDYNYCPSLFDDMLRLENLNELGIKWKECIDLLRFKHSYYYKVFI